MLTNQAEIRVYSGLCPDGECRTKLFFPSYAASSIECTGCGKHHNKDSLHQVQLIKDPEEALRNLLRSVLLTRSSLKKGTDLVKVKGYSNYHCRLISPLLTTYGMDRTSQARLLRDMGQGEVFDCSHVGDRAFAIEPEYLDTPGYGRDKSGSIGYLHEITEAIKLVNDSEDRLVPLHVDGDGHCLVHAISRALVGREIFWHPLMVNLQSHLQEKLKQYEALFVDFIGHDEWDLIISEAGPDFQPPDDQPLGLRTIHIFGLANVLHRPIMLLDSVSGIQSSADYSGTFLPALVPPHLCKDKYGKLIPPLAIAWSNSARNHYIPLVNIRDRPAVRIPSWIIPKAWGIPDELIKEYIDFDDKDLCTIGGTRTMSDSYLHRLMKAMDDKFFDLNGVSASIVTEVHQFIFKPSGVVGVRPQTVIDRTKQRIHDQSLMRCIACQAVSEYDCPVNKEWLAPGGKMYVSAAHVEGGLSSGQAYSFPDQHLVCSYDADNDVLKPVKYQGKDVTLCSLCQGSLRTVTADGSPVYVNGDRTTKPVTGKTKCMCGFKHFWNGKEYDNLPEVFGSMTQSVWNFLARCSDITFVGDEERKNIYSLSIPVALEWGGKSIKETVHWFQHESDESLNSNVYAVAGKLVQKHFPGEFGSERLVQKVVDTILRQTARKEGDNKGARPDIPNLPPSTSPPQPEGAVAEPFVPSKIILTGQKKKTFHKEELTQSDTERKIKIKTEHHAVLTQQRQTKLQKSPEKSPPKQQSNKPSTSSLPTPSSPQLPRTDKKIRLTSSSGGQHALTLPLDVTFSQLQDAIYQELGIPPGDQKIRYGFPPRLLHPPEEGKEEEPIPIQHGDRVMVEVLPPPEPVPRPQTDVEMVEEKKMDVAGAMGGQGHENTQKPEEEEKQDTPMDVDFDTSALASVLMSALAGNLTNDLWEAACRTPQMFEKDGYYYNLVANDLGPLQDNQHFSIPNLPNKIFSYNKDKDHLELCLGNVHLPVQPLNQETLSLAHNQQLPTSKSTSTAQQSSSVMSTEASFSGVISKTSGRAQKAFSGEGRSLSGSSPVSPRQPPEQQQAPSLPSEDISEVFMTSKTATTSNAQDGSVTSTTTNPTTEEQLMAVETSRTDKPVEESSVVEELNQTNKLEDELSIEDKQTSSPTEALTMVKQGSDTDKQANESTIEDSNQTASQISSILTSTQSSTDVDMTKDKPSASTAEESDARGVVMETDLDGNDPKTGDNQQTCEETELTSADKTRIATEGDMDVDQLDQKQSSTTMQDTGNISPEDTSQDNAVPTTGNPNLNNSKESQEANTGNLAPSKIDLNTNEGEPMKESRCFEEEKREMSENVVRPDDR